MRYKIKLRESHKVRFKRGDRGGALALRIAVEKGIHNQQDLDMFLAQLPENMREIALERVRPYLKFTPAPIASTVDETKSSEDVVCSEAGAEQQS